MLLANHAVLLGAVQGSPSGATNGQARASRGFPVSELAAIVHGALGVAAEGQAGGPGVAVLGRTRVGGV